MNEGDNSRLEVINLESLSFCILFAKDLSKSNIGFPNVIVTALTVLKLDL